jgi:hypothetical protein
VTPAQARRRRTVLVVVIPLTSIATALLELGVRHA